jgi:hypothetical protein
MKTGSKTLNLAICMLLFRSCDLLYTDEEGEVVFITVTDTLQVCTKTVEG